jgi:hypothetical protein
MRCSSGSLVAATTRDVDGIGDIITDTADFAFLEDTEDPALEQGRHGTDFVEENGAAVGFLEQAFLVIESHR